LYNLTVSSKLVHGPPGCFGIRLGLGSPHPSPWVGVQLPVSVAQCDDRPQEPALGIGGNQRRGVHERRSFRHSAKFPHTKWSGKSPICRSIHTLPTGNTKIPYFTIVSHDSATKSSIPNSTLIPNTVTVEVSSYNSTIVFSSFFLAFPVDLAT